MPTMSKKEISASEDQPKKANEIVEILQESIKALLAKKHVVAHSCIRLAITGIRTAWLDGWIPVSERLPELPSGPPNAYSERVWLIFKDKPQMGYYTNFDGWRIYGFRFQKRLNQKDITHWKPIILPV